MKALIIMATIIQLFIVTTKASVNKSFTPAELIKETCQSKPNHTYINDGKFVTCIPSSEVSEYLKQSN